MARTSYALDLLCLTDASLFGRISTGLAVLEVIEEEQLQKNAEEVGHYLLQQLKPLQKVRPRSTLTDAGNANLRLLPICICCIVDLCHGVMHAC